MDGTLWISLYALAIVLSKIGIKNKKREVFID